MLISVTREHIAAGKCKSPYACPVALAINEAQPVGIWCVGCCHIMDATAAAGRGRGVDSPVRQGTTRRADGVRVGDLRGWAGTATRSNSGRA